MKKAIAVAAMAVVVVIAGITGASSGSSCSCILQSSRNSSDVFICAASEWLLSPPVPLISALELSILPPVSTKLPMLLPNPTCTGWLGKK